MRDNLVAIAEGVTRRIVDDRLCTGHNHVIDARKLDNEHEGAVTGFRNRTRRRTGSSFQIDLGTPGPRRSFELGCDHIEPFQPHQPIDEPAQLAAQDENNLWHTFSAP
jgi:hypothetical protein